MKRRILTGLILGCVAGIIDVTPMVIQKLTWDANLSAFTLWVVVGVMIATSNLPLAPIPQGMAIAVLCLLPSTFIIGWREPMALIPIMAITLVLGALLGHTFHKLVKGQ